MKRWALVIIIIAALCGAVVAAISTSQHFRIQSKGFEEASFCVINEKINCDIVNASSYSEVFGLPVASLGFIYYLLVAAMAVFALVFKKEWMASLSFAWFMSIAGLAYSAYLAYIAFFILGVVCIECLFMYLINIILAVFLFISLNISLGGAMKFVKDYFCAVFGKAKSLGFKPHIVRYIVVATLMFLVGGMIVKDIEAKDDKQKTKVTVDEKVSAFYMQSLYDLEPDPNWPVWGNPNAKVAIVEFSDFQCPVCKLAAFNVKPYLQEFHDNVRFYFVNYPLDQSCNEQLDHPMHDWACFAARAAVCANKDGKFWELHDDIFKNQKGMNPEKILDLAEKHGWKRDAFKECVDSPQVFEQVKKDIATGRHIYVSGTPTIILDNRQLRYWQDPKFLQEVVRQEIKKQK